MDKNRNTGYKITIDTGTTNTRAVLWSCDGEKLQEAKESVGVGITAQEGTNHKLKTAIKTCLIMLLDKQQITYDEISYIVASGMITSNLGIVEVPHLAAPVGIEELAKGVVRKNIPEIAPIPIHFIPGLKNSVDCSDLKYLGEMDIMRGEEVEVMGVLPCMDEQPALIILPGSHTKFVFTDERKRITGCLTSMTGEILSFLTLHSIAADAAGRQFVTEETYDPYFVERGYRMASREGMGRAAFSGRIMNQFFVKEKTKAASYLLGVALESDMRIVQNLSREEGKKPRSVVVTGDGIVSRALYDLLQKEDGMERIQWYHTENGKSLSSEGAITIMDRIIV